MKKKALNILALIAFIAILSGCKKDAKQAETSESKDLPEVSTAAKFKALPAESMIHWKASKVVGGHEGTISISNGVANFEGNTLVGGNFVFDIKTLSESEDNTKLIGHLLSADFFDAEQFPNAAFEITKVDGNQVSGNLSIKNIKKNISFPAVITISEDEASITSEAFSIDRTEWDIKYNSGKFGDPAKLGDKMINDNVEIKIMVKAKRA